MKTVFGVLSAIAPATTVADLAQTLGNDAVVLVHHDRSQQPDFAPRGANIEFVDDPVRTGWANWGLTQAVFKLMETALARHDFDYFQLMTPACMPIRPRAELLAHLQLTHADFHVDHLPLATMPMIEMSHGYRALAPEGSFRYRALWKAREWYFGQSPPTENLSNLSFPTTSRIELGGSAGALARLGKRLTDIAGHPKAFWHPYSEDFRCHVGCSWFGASRAGCEHLLERRKNRALMKYFSHVSMPNEIMFPTLIANSGLRIAPSNHLLSTFEGARPRTFGFDDLAMLRDSPRFFARKFPEAPDAAIRVAVREQLLEARTRTTAITEPPVEEPLFSMAG